MLKFGVMGTDYSWYLDVNSFARHSPDIHGFMKAYALWLGLVALVLMIVGGYLLARRRRDAPRAVTTVFLAGLGGVIALAVNQPISNAIARVRPCHAHHHVEVLLGCAHDYSLPSDHCMIGGAFAAGLLLVNRRLGAVAVLFAGFLAFARVYVGVHYPGDVAAGLGMGAAVGLIVIFALRRPVTVITRGLSHSPLKPLVAARLATDRA